MHAREAELRLWTRPARSVPASEHRRGRGPQFPHLYKGRRAPTSLKELPYVTGFECSPLPPPPVHRHLMVDALSEVNWQLLLSLCSVVVPPKIDGIIDQIKYYKKHTALNAGRDLGCSRCYQQGCRSRKETGWHLLSVLGHLIVRTDKDSHPMSRLSTARLGTSRPLTCPCRARRGQTQEAAGHDHGHQLPALYGQ